MTRKWVGVNGERKKDKWSEGSLLSSFNTVTQKQISCFDLRSPELYTHCRCSCFKDAPQCTFTLHALCWFVQPKFSFVFQFNSVHSEMNTDMIVTLNLCLKMWTCTALCLPCSCVLREGRFWEMPRAVWEGHRCWQRKPWRLQTNSKVSLIRSIYIYSFIHSFIHSCLYSGESTHSPLLNLEDRTDILCILRPQYIFFSGWK